MPPGPHLLFPGPNVPFSSNRLTALMCMSHRGGVAYGQGDVQRL